MAYTYGPILLQPGQNTYCWWVLPEAELKMRLVRIVPAYAPTLPNRELKILEEYVQANERREVTYGILVENTGTVACLFYSLFSDPL